MLALKDADPFELDVLRIEVVEEAASLSEQQRDDVELELVVYAGRQGELGDRGTVDGDVLVAGGLLGIGHGGFDIGDVGYERPAADVDARLVATVDDDRHPVVMIAAPAIGRLEGPAPATIAPVALSSSQIWLLMSSEERREVASPGVTPAGNQPCK
jgi:hypothetical protein